VHFHFGLFFHTSNVTFYNRVEPIRLLPLTYRYDE